MVKNTNLNLAEEEKRVKSKPKHLKFFPVGNIHILASNSSHFLLSVILFWPYFCIFSGQYGLPGGGGSTHSTINIQLALQNGYKSFPMIVKEGQQCIFTCNFYLLWNLMFQRSWRTRLLNVQPLVHIPNTSRMSHFGPKWNKITQTTRNKCTRVHHESTTSTYRSRFWPVSFIWMSYDEIGGGQYRANYTVMKCRALTRHSNGKIHKTQVPTVWIPWDFHKTHLFPWKVCLFWHLNPQRKLAGVHLHSELQWRDRDTPPFLQ